jgi:hypothetical protein
MVVPLWQVSIAIRPADVGSTLEISQYKGKEFGQDVESAVVVNKIHLTHTWPHLRMRTILAGGRVVISYHLERQSIYRTLGRYRMKMHKFLELLYYGDLVDFASNLLTRLYARPHPFHIAPGG